MSVQFTDNRGLKDSLQARDIFDLPLYTPEIVAEKLSVSPKSVTKWLREKKLCGIKIGRLWRIRPSDLAAFLGPLDDDPLCRILDNAPVDESILSDEDRRTLREAERDIDFESVIIASDVSK